MALSGTINGTCTGIQGSNYNIWADWTVNSQNIKGNTSNVTVIMRLQWGGSSSSSAYNLKGKNPVYLDVQYFQKVAREISIDTQNHAVVELARWTGNIDHDNNGQLALNISGVFTMNGVPNLTGGSVEGTVSVNSIDRTAPSVSLSVSSITTSSARLSASSNARCNLWEYSKDGGNSWTTFSTSNSSSAAKTVYGLSPNTEYRFKVRARKTSNYIYGRSSTVTKTTIGVTTINHYVTIKADDTTAKILMNLTVANSSFNHKLELYEGSTKVLVITGITASYGTNNKTVTLTADQRTTLLTHMKYMESFNGTLKLTTYDGNTYLGTSNCPAVVKTDYESSHPLFSGFTYKDINAETASITEDNQILIQNYSRLQIICNQATPRNEAEIKKYSAICANKSMSCYGTIIKLNEINTSGTFGLTVSVTDSRGYTKSWAKIIDVIPYTKPIIESVNIRRQNSVDDIIQLTFSGHIYDILVNEVNKNSITAISYRYKKTNETAYSTWKSLLSDCTLDGNNFSYSSINAFSLNANFSWDVQFRVRDKLTEYIYDGLVPQGTPLIEIRPKKVSVGGDILMNGTGILGSKTQTAIDFNTLTEQGVYFFDISDSSKQYSHTHPPSLPYNANVIVINPSGSLVTQMYFAYDYFYIRYGTLSSGAWSWSDWTQK